ncbi:SAM-dependent methyltransferase [Pseudonocardia sp. GCM10023141]|uniref:SAM-dependent methyltransferase n=1 Tax=Pseudonocardia sp. GCM10023141 TaxID=3252653 RepID=UPI003614183A
MLTETGSPVCPPEWLTLREPADAAARSAELAALAGARIGLGLRRHDHLGEAGPIVVRDLGCGTGSMGRWLAPRLPGPQHWVLHDRDPALLRRAAIGLPAVAADGSAVTVATACGELGDLDGSALAGTSLVAASALLDMLTAAELERLVDGCVTACCPVLLALSVVGEVTLAPAEPLDAELAAAFDAHQRRDGLLGPAAAAAAAAAFTRRGYAVHVRPTPWRLGPQQAELAEEWLCGWVSAACAQRPELDEVVVAYLQRRIAACRAGDLQVVVGHVDVLALPGGKPSCAAPS